MLALGPQQLLQQFQTVGLVLVVKRIVNGEIVAVAFCHVHGDIGALHELGAGIRVFREGREADAHTHF